MDTTSSRARQFQKRAEEICRVASAVTDAECRRALLGLAERYEQLSQRITETTDRQPVEHRINVRWR